MTTIEELIEYVESMMGAEVRGRTVLDTDIRLQGDYSGNIILTIGVGKTFAERIDPDVEETQLAWHFDDIRTIAPGDARWEYWDEFADRQLREDDATAILTPGPRINPPPFR